MMRRLYLFAIVLILLATACGSTSATPSPSNGDGLATEPQQWLHDVIITVAMEIEVVGEADSDYQPPNPELVVAAQVLDILFWPAEVTATDGATLEFDVPTAGDSVTITLSGLPSAPATGMRYVVLATSNEVVGTTEATEWFSHEVYETQGFETLTNALRPHLDDLIPWEGTPETRRATLVEYLVQSHEYREATLNTTSAVTPGPLLALAFDLADVPPIDYSPELGRSVSDYLALDPADRQLVERSFMPEPVIEALDLIDFHAVITYDNDFAEKYWAVGFRTSEGVVGPYLTDATLLFDEVHALRPQTGDIEVLVWEAEPASEDQWRSLLRLAQPLDPDIVINPIGPVMELATASNFLIVDLRTGDLELKDINDLDATVDDLARSAGEAARREIGEG